MFHLVPEHSDSRKNCVKIDIYPKEKVKGFSLYQEGKMVSDFTEGTCINIDKNGSYRAKIKTHTNTDMTIDFTISFLSSRCLFDGGDGSPEHPYLISSIEQLNAIRINLSAHYKLMADIDLSQWGMSWVPIGSYVLKHGEVVDGSKAFTGTLDGNNHMLCNLTCRTAGLTAEKSIYPFEKRQDESGLFGCCVNATVRNIFLKDCYIVGNYGAGSFTGSHSDCLFENCHASGKIYAKAYAAGISSFGDRSRFYQCSYQGVIHCDSFGAGITIDADILQNCEANIFISCENPCGICTRTVSEVKNCIVRGVFEGLSLMSGISSIWGTHTKISGCICALERISLLESDDFITEYPRFSAIDNYKCDENTLEQTEHKNNFHIEAMTFDGIKYWKDDPELDGAVITKVQLHSQKFLQNLSWRFDENTWEMSPDGPHLRFANLGRIRHFIDQ